MNEIESIFSHIFLLIFLFHLHPLACHKKGIFFFLFRQWNFLHKRKARRADVTAALSGVKYDTNHGRTSVSCHIIITHWSVCRHGDCVCVFTREAANGDNNGEWKEQHRSRCYSFPVQSAHQQRAGVWAKSGCGSVLRLLVIIRRGRLKKPNTPHPCENNLPNLLLRTLIVMKLRV